MVYLDQSWLHHYYQSYLQTDPRQKFDQASKYLPRQCYGPR